MTSQTEELAVHLKNNSSTPSSAYHAAGWVTFVSILTVSIAIKEEDLLLGLFFPGVALFALALAKFSERINALDFAILYPDRIEIPEFRNSRRIVHWNQVSELRWLGAHGSSPQLRIYTNEFKNPLGFFQMNLSNLAVEDRLTFIRYVRKSAPDIEQKHWLGFCRNTAFPLLDRIEQKKTRENNQEDTEPLGWREKFAIKFLELMGAHPFFASLVMPVTFLLALPLFISRHICWTVTAILAISSFINIRLVWGQWLEPFTTACLGTAAMLFFLGFFSLPRKTVASNSQRSLSTAKAVSYFTLFLVGIPFAVNALAKGWIPNNFAQPLKWLTLILFTGPILLFSLKPSKHKKCTKNQFEKEALERWEAADDEAAAG